MNLQPKTTDNNDGVQRQPKQWPFLTLAAIMPCALGPMELLGLEKRVTKALQCALFVFFFNEERDVVVGTTI